MEKYLDPFLLVNNEVNPGMEMKIGRSIIYFNRTKVIIRVDIDFSQNTFDGIKNCRPQATVFYKSFNV